MTACGYCQAEVHDTTICGRCVRITTAHLRDIPDHFEELTTVMVKDTVYADRSDGGKSVDPTIAWARMGDMFLDQVASEIEHNPIATPYAKAAAACLHELRATLVSWCRLLNDERQLGLPRPTVPFMAEHLRRNMRIIASHEAAGAFVAETVGLVKQIMVVVDSPQFRSRVPVGPCIQIIEGADCTGQIVAYTFTDPELIGKLACRRCKAEWEPPKWHDISTLILAKRGQAAA